MTFSLRRRFAIFSRQHRAVECENGRRLDGSKLANFVLLNSYFTNAILRKCLTLLKTGLFKHKHSHFGSNKYTIICICVVLVNALYTTLLCFMRQLE